MFISFWVDADDVVLLSVENVPFLRREEGDVDNGGGAQALVVFQVRLDIAQLQLDISDLASCALSVGRFENGEELVLQNQRLACL